MTFENLSDEHSRSTAGHYVVLLVIAQTLPRQPHLMPQVISQSQPSSIQYFDVLHKIVALHWVLNFLVKTTFFKQHVADIYRYSLEYVRITCPPYRFVPHHKAASPAWEYTP